MYQTNLWLIFLFLLRFIIFFLQPVGKKKVLEESSDCFENDLEDDQYNSESDVSEIDLKLNSKILSKRKVFKSKSKIEVKNSFGEEVDDNEINDKIIYTQKNEKKYFFKCGDVVAVHTEVGMWPAIIVSKLN